VYGRDYISGTSSEYEASQIAKWFFKEVFRLHRFPKYIDHDWDNTVLMTFWQEQYRLVGTKLISVAQLESIGMRHSGLQVWMWVPRTHMIGPFHFWDTPRGDDGSHAIWQDRFSLSIPRIEYDNGLADFDSTKAHLQDMIHSSGVGSSRHYGLGFEEWRLHSRHEGHTVMIRVA
jgi:hypothetical protein